MKDLTTFGLAKKNIKNKPGRSYVLMALTGILCFILFLSSFLIVSLKNGMGSLSDRMGADIIVVPEGYDSKVAGAILRGEPNSFFFEDSVIERVNQIPGIEKASPQLFLATLTAGCCSFPIQIIGIDFEKDFIVVPWLEKQLKLPLNSGEILVGNNVRGDYNSQVKFFNQPFNIKGRLAKTGMGFDNTVFMTMEETRRLAKEYEKLLKHPLAKQENLISCVMVKLEKGKDAKEVADNIREEFKGEAVYPLISQRMMTEVSDNVQNLSSYVYLLIILIWILAFFVLTLVYSMMMKERKREFAMLRILGSTKSKLKKIVLAETLYINGYGAIAGTCFAFVIAFLYSRAISEYTKMPFLVPNIMYLIGIFLGTILLGTLLGPLSSILSLNRMTKREPAILLREND